MSARTLSAMLTATLALAAGCRHDPVAQDIIDNLPPEQGTPSATHRPGQPCLACHTAYGGAQPELAVAGTVFSLDATMKHLVPAPNIRVTITDSGTDMKASETKKACTNKAGNFFVTKDNWSDITYPLSPAAGGVSMQSLVGRDGSCASCHTLPDADSLDPVTGAGRSSSGAIIVDATHTDPDCGGGE